MTDTLYTALEAATALGRPHIARTLARRAKAIAGTDAALRRIGYNWAAPLEWWERQAATIPRKPGRPGRSQIPSQED